MDEVALGVLSEISTMQGWALLAIVALHAAPPAVRDTGQACLDSIRFPFGPEACLEAARDTAGRRLDTVVARVLDVLPDAQRTAFDSASRRWSDYLDAECDLPLKLATRDRTDSGSVGFRTVVGCHARLMDDRRQMLGVTYQELLGHSATLPRCQHFEPDTVALVGTLERHTYPGLPDYESIAHGDQPESGWYLRVATPLCVTGNLTAFNTPMAGVHIIQIDPSSAESRVFARRRGQRVAVQGVLFEPGTMHWHARLALRTLAATREIGVITSVTPTEALHQ